MKTTDYKGAANLLRTEAQRYAVTSPRRQEMEAAAAVAGARDAELAQKDATIKALAGALRESAPRISPTRGPCWCPPSVKDIPAAEDEHGTLCVSWRRALRLAGVLK